MHAAGTPVFSARSARKSAIGEAASTVGGGEEARKVTEVGVCAPVWARSARSKFRCPDFSARATPDPVKHRSTLFGTL